MMHRHNQRRSLLRSDRRVFAHTVLSNQQPHRGAAAVEFAIVFPLVLIFFIGIIAVSQAFILRDLSQLAAYEGARAGTILDATSEDIRTETERVLTSMRVQGAEITIEPTQLTNSTPRVRVTVRIPIADNAWVAGPLVPSIIDVGSSVELQKNAF